MIFQSIEEFDIFIYQFHCFIIIIQEYMLKFLDGGFLCCVIFIDAGCLVFGLVWYLHNGCWKNLFIRILW